MFFGLVFLLFLRGFAGWSRGEEKLWLNDAANRTKNENEQSNQGINEYPRRNKYLRMEEVTEGNVIALNHSIPSLCSATFQRNDDENAIIFRLCTSIRLR